MAKPKQGTTTYLLTMSDDTLRKVTVPDTWKVTFGPLVPGSKGIEGMNGRAGICLRFYEDKDKQRAVFTDVKSFRDTSIAIEERVTRTQQETYTKDTPEGAKQVIVEGHVHEWRNPDAPGKASAEFLKLPEGTKRA